MVTKTNTERVLDYLWSVGPAGATNAQIREATGIESHQQVFMITRDLMYRRKIRGEKVKGEWVFYELESLDVLLLSPGRASPAEPPARLTSRQFEDLAQTVMSSHFGVPLTPGEVAGVSKEWDMVSPDGDIVGDAKYLTLVQGQRLPPAKFSIIAEHVWLLEKTGASVAFLVFGNDRQVPALWLQRYGKLASGVAFYFLADDGRLELLQESADE